MKPPTILEQLSDRLNIINQWGPEFFKEAHDKCCVRYGEGQFNFDQLMCEAIGLLVRRTEKDV